MVKIGVIEDIIDNFCKKPYNAKYILNEILFLFKKYIKHPKKIIINQSYVKLSYLKNNTFRSSL